MFSGAQKRLVRRLNRSATTALVITFRKIIDFLTSSLPSCHFKGTGSPDKYYCYGLRIKINQYFMAAGLYIFRMPGGREK
jgi:hypothetical protein